MSTEAIPLTLSDIISNYSDVSDGTGKLEGSYHLFIVFDIAPVVHPPRTAPLVIKGRLQSEVDKPVVMSIITPVTEPTI